MTRMELYSRLYLAFIEGARQADPKLKLWAGVSIKRRQLLVKSAQDYAEKVCAEISHQAIY